jgi:integrase
VTAPSTFRSKADANVFLATVEADMVRGHYVDPHAGRVTVSAWSENWLNRPGKRAATVARDRQCIAVFLPALGSMRLSAVTPAQIQTAVDERSRLVAPATMTREFASLRTMFNAAVHADLITRSPARKIALPRIVRPKRATLTPNQLRALVDELPAHYQTLVLTSGVLGLAWQEVIALRIRDIDFDQGTVRVEQTVEELAGQIRFVPEGKRPARLRTITAPPFLLAAIPSHLASHRAAVANDSDALVFVGPKGGTLRRRFGERIFRPAVERAGLQDLTFHGLRHAAASSLVDVGVHPRVMASRIGHGSVKTTMEIYAHASDDADRQAASLLEEQFGGAFSAVAHPAPTMHVGEEHRADKDEP